MYLLGTLLRVATYLITGVAGFIGSHLAEALIARGHRVRGVDNFSTGRRENLASVARQVDLITADVADFEAMERACRGVDAILHEAALPSVPRSVKDPRTSHRNNIDGTFNLLEAARGAGVRRLVYAASSSAYGNQPGFPRVETMRPEPASPYAVQKLTGELYMSSYASVFGMETVSLRYFNIFGPRQAPDSPYSGVVARWSLEMLRGRHDPAAPRPVLQGTGEQARDFTYIDNAVEANLLALTAPAERVAGKVFNVGCGASFTLNDLYRAMAGLTGYTQPPTRTDARGGDVMMSLASIEAAREAMGYTAAVGFEEGLARTIDWYRAQMDGKAAEAARLPAAGARPSATK